VSVKKKLSEERVRGEKEEIEEEEDEFISLL